MMHKNVNEQRTDHQELAECAQAAGFQELLAAEIASDATVFATQ